MSVLDLFLPGFTNITSTVSQALSGNLTGYTHLMCVFALAAFLKPYVFQLRSWFIEHFTSTVHIKHSDETYDMIQTWISSRGLDDAARSLLAKVRTKQEAHEGHDTRTKKALRYAPWEGSFCFWYKKNLLFYQTTQVDVGFHREEQISVTCVGRSSRILKGLLEDCRLEYLNESKNKTTIHGHRDDRWRKEKAVTVRPLSTVILDQKQKEPLIRDLRDFLDPQTRRRYSEHSIPYKRGYLLYGPPGTGKSSFSLSIAGELDMDIYVVSIPSTNDQMLKGLFAGLPDRCVVLLEDIDAAGATCSREQRHGHEITKEGVTLSGLLNALDGVASQEDRVLIMTTNHPKKLDPALIRPGRVDLKVEFQLADRGITKEIYRFMFGQPESNIAEVSQQEGCDGKVERQVDAFAAKVPESEFSPAEIMSYLLRHWHSPATAIEHCDQWADDLLQEKKAKKGASKDGRKSQRD
ncbi:P-loop containing nucleoside triphosphate hydrolase protein [Thelonectria olida]|uniref:P-loop containing nucleoside triphosphate hydrolase protein n=1 Tax=Thelonectria olida TaxID=1576542 RepID=A0A9P8W0B6_9HYPO|nr:P-loop containing nucleoside triphosphate hydrolase protein [Thelonectria olida]